MGETDCADDGGEGVDCDFDEEVLLAMEPVEETEGEGSDACESDDEDVGHGDSWSAVHGVVEGRDGGEGHVDADACEVETVIGVEGFCVRRGYFGPWDA